MGCGSSKIEFQPKDDIPGQDEAAVELFETLGLESKDVDIFYKIFCEIDVNHTQSVRPKEIFNHFNVDLGNFEDGIFAIFDDGNTKLLNFMEYVCAMWNLLTLKDKYLAVICYLMKDPTGALRIKYPHVKEIIEMMHKKKVESTPALQQMYANLKGNFGGEISMKELCEWAGDNQSLLTPLLVLQIKMRRFIIGEKFWMRMSEERSSHPERSQLDFTKRLSSMVKRRNEHFHRRMALKQQEAAVEAQRAKFSRGSSRSDMERKQSMMMKSFNLGIAKQPKKDKNESFKESDQSRPSDSETKGNKRIDQRSSSKKLGSSSNSSGDMNGDMKGNSNVQGIDVVAASSGEERKPLKKQKTKRGKAGVSFSEAVDASSRDMLAASGESERPGASADESPAQGRSSKKPRPKSGDKLNRSSSKKHKLSDAEGGEDAKSGDAEKKKSRPKSAGRSKSKDLQDAAPAGENNDDAAPPLPPDIPHQSPPKLQRQGTNSKKLRKSNTSSKGLSMDAAADDDDIVAEGLESPSKKPRPRSSSKGSSNRSPDKNRSSSKKLDVSTSPSG